MTYTTTHLALQGLTLWLLLSKKDKVYYKEHRWEFILINLFATLPDLDIFFGYHRSYTHSIIIPTFILLCFMIIGRFNKDEGPIETTGQKTIRFIKLASIMWILHIILDLSWGALLLFWPLDSNFYDLTIYLRFSNQPWLFFPLSLVGIIPDWTIYSPTEGQGIFITNLSQQERETLYGEFIDLYIEQ
ncbi:MAG: metal-dependent hydrolase, partial [Candidatus Thorarchaeota archaeon]